MKKTILTLGLVICVLLNFAAPAFAWELIPYDPEVANSYGTTIMLDSCSVDGQGTMNIPAYINGISVGSIQDTVFKNCNNLKNIVVDAENIAFSSENGVLFNKEKTILMRYPCDNEAKTYVIPDGVKIIDAEAFLNCDNLTTIEIPDSVRVIRNNAFRGCLYLKQVNYTGSEGKWKSIGIGSENGSLLGAEIHYNAEKTSVASAADDTIKVIVNNVHVAFDQPPVLENGRTLVPLRAIFEALGASIGWDDATKTVTATKDGIEISLQIGAEEMYVNGEAKLLDVPAKLINSRTLVPVRAISEAFNCQVTWIDDIKSVVITQ